MLRIKLSDLSKEGLKIKAGTIYFFVTRTGQCFVNDEGITSGFDSVWQRRMRKIVEAGDVRFNEHDIRAKTASDLALSHATDLMMHRSKEFTDKVYRRKTKVVAPRTKEG